MTTDNLIERARDLVNRYNEDLGQDADPSRGLAAMANYGDLALRMIARLCDELERSRIEWQPIETALENGVLQTGKPFLAVKRPFDPQVVHIEDGKVVRFNDDGTVTAVRVEQWIWLPRPSEPPSEE